MIRLDLLPLITALGVVEFWWIVIPAQLFILYFWFFKWQRKINDVVKDYYTTLLIILFSSLDLLGLLFFTQQTIRIAPPLWILLLLTYSFYLSLLLTILSLIFTASKHFLTRL